MPARSRPPPLPDQTEQPLLNCERHLNAKGHETTSSAGEFTMRIYERTPIQPCRRRRSLTARPSDLSVTLVALVEAGHPRRHDPQGKFGVADVHMVLGILGVREQSRSNRSGRGERVELIAELSPRDVVIL